MFCQLLVSPSSQLLVSPSSIYKAGPNILGTRDEKNIMDPNYIKILINKNI